MKTQRDPKYACLCVRPLAAVLTFGIAAGLAALPAGAQAKHAAAESPVVVELFTSEGCSDCPAADEALATLDRAQPVTGARVIALEEHVDYWNHSGWADPFSSHALTQRQGQYADHFGADDVYTPEMIVDGSAPFVGSDRPLAARSIARAAHLPKAPVRISDLRASGDSITFQVSVGQLPGASSGGSDTADVIAAVTEDGLVSRVAGGENGGRTLHHVAVVRALRSIGAVSGPASEFTVRMPLARGWRRENLNVAAFVQERASRRIDGADEEPIHGSDNGSSDN